MDTLKKINETLSWSEISDILNYNLNSITISGDNLEDASGVDKGLFENLAELKLAYPEPQKGWHAFVYDTGNIYLCYTVDDDWYMNSTTPINSIDLDKFVYMESMFVTRNIPVLIEISPIEVSDDLLSFSNGILLSGTDTFTAKIKKEYQGESETLTWISGILQKPRLYTLQVCTLNSMGESRGDPNPLYLDFLDGKLFNVREQ